MTEIITIDADNKPAANFLESYFQSGNLNFLIGSGASFPAIQTAGNIESEINSLLAANKEDEAAQKSLQFIKKISEANSKISTTAFGSSTLVPFRKVKDSYTKFLSSIDRILFARKNILLARQANIFTTNYDVFIEHSASKIPGLILNDGFDRSSPTIQPIFAPERYFDRTYRSGPFSSHQIEIPTINLIKLHGSLSWRQKQNRVVYDIKPIQAPSAEDETDPTKVTDFLKKHFLILPNLQKFHVTLMERTYYDLLRLFSRALDQQNAILLAFGFSFVDEHILDLTRRALRNPTSHLIVLAYDQKSTTDYQTKFTQQRNVTVLSPGSGSVIDFPRLNQILASILPASTHASA
ncbi:SIR2 family protein [Bradyrhizobium oligotrophicum]|uniref:SIR2 family protein n=1 Tax=Bradyrhizobium oligotrophicum TaxID=44255 RepID=UPI003EBA73E2